MSATESAIGATTEAAITAQLDKWKRLALSNAPIDRGMAREGVRQVYQLVGRRPPTHIVWLDSVPVACRAVALLSKIMAMSYEPVVQSFKSEFSDRLWKRIEARSSKAWWQDVEARMAKSTNLAYGRACDQIRQAVSFQFGFRPHDGIAFERQELQMELLGYLLLSLHDQLPAQLLKAIPGHYTEWGRTLSPESATTQCWRCGLGNQDPDLPFYDFCRQAGFNLSELDGMMALANSCGWWWPLEDVCIVTARPLLMRTDDLGRLHSDQGAAVRYRDSWEIHAWHGGFVPKRFISFAKNMNVHDIMHEPNIEIRRRMLDLYGLEAFMLASGAQKLQEDKFGALYRQELAGDEPVVVVCVTNSTAEPDGHFKKYFLRVPPTVRTAREGVAWTFGLAPLQYTPDKQT